MCTSGFFCAVVLTVVGLRVKGVWDLLSSENKAIISSLLWMAENPVLNYYKDSVVLLERVPLQFSLRETIKCVRIELLGLSCTSLVNQACKDYFCLVPFLHLG